MLATTEARLPPEGLAHFKAWLRDCVARDGRTVLAISKAAGVNYVTLRYHLSEQEARPTERNARRLASFFNADFRLVRSWLAYTDEDCPSPDPSGFASMAEWIAAALRARHESAGHAAARLGITASTFQRWLLGGGLTRPSISLLAIYFGVDAAALRHLRGRQWGKVAAAQARSDRMGREYMRGQAARARAAAASRRIV